MSKKQIHLTADVPADLVDKVNAAVEELGFTRSFAIRKGLSLFLSHYSQELTKTVNKSDGLSHIKNTKRKRIDSATATPAEDGDHAA